VRLRRDARGGYDGIRQELAAGVAPARIIRSRIRSLDDSARQSLRLAEMPAIDVGASTEQYAPDDNCSQEMRPLIGEFNLLELDFWVGQNQP